MCFKNLCKAVLITPIMIILPEYHFFLKAVPLSLVERVAIKNQSHLGSVSRVTRCVVMGTV